MTAVVIKLLLNHIGQKRVNDTSVQSDVEQADKGVKQQTNQVNFCEMKLVPHYQTFAGSRQENG